MKKEIQRILELEYDQLLRIVEAADTAHRRVPTRLLTRITEIEKKLGYAAHDVGVGVAGKAWIVFGAFGIISGLIAFASAKRVETALKKGHIELDFNKDKLPTILDYVVDALHQRRITPIRLPLNEVIKAAKGDSQAKGVLDTVLQYFTIKITEN